MSSKIKLTQEEKDLTRRYLIWCYKTTKEELDRIDRYFTQLQVDDYILDLLEKESSSGKSPKDQEYLQKIKDFKTYIDKKEKNVLPKKFLDDEGETFTPEYRYLNNRLMAIESAIVHFFDKVELRDIRHLYEQEMTRRILEARDHS